MAATSTQRSASVPVAAPGAALAAAVAVLLVSAPLRAAAVDPARVRVAAALIDNLVRGLLPVDLVLPGPIGGSADAGIGSSSTAAVITELNYCGVTDKGGGRLRAVIRSGSFGRGSAPPLLTGADGCRHNLGDLAKQLSAADSPGEVVVVADVEAVWRAWDLRLTILRAVGPTPPRPGPPRPLAGLETGRDLLTVSTAGFRIVTDAGEPITFHVAPSFASDGVEILAVVGENGAVPPTTRPAASGSVAALSGDTNVSADLPFAFANQILRHVTGVQPLAIRIDRDVVDLQNVAVGAAGGGIAVTGLATPRSVRETLRLSVQVGGSELRVASVRAEAQLENCAGLGMLAAVGCNARNAGRNAAAAAFAAAMTQKYQGQLVRELAGVQNFRFDVGARRLELRGDVLRVGPGARGLSVGARFVTGSQDH